MYNTFNPYGYFNNYIGQQQQQPLQQPSYGFNIPQSQPPLQPQPQVNINYGTATAAVQQVNNPNINDLLGTVSKFIQKWQSPNSIFNFVNKAASLDLNGNIIKGKLELKNEELTPSLIDEIVKSHIGFGIGMYEDPDIDIFILSGVMSELITPDFDDLMEMHAKGSIKKIDVEM